MTLDEDLKKEGFNQVATNTVQELAKVILDDFRNYLADSEFRIIPIYMALELPNPEPMDKILHYLYLK
ncbi:hypothetical protein J4223_00320 [Candidatus Woesearchaeota archaeon]|nr:hypothetical protein [Candidatus Woesearchaeota archaeon]